MENTNSRYSSYEDICRCEWCGEFFDNQTKEKILSPVENYADGCCCEECKKIVATLNLN